MKPFRNKRTGGEETPSIRKNYTYNLIYQVMTLLTPFLTTPYIARVLGPEGTGVQSYTSSVVQYFAILAALGTVSYGQREIARHRDSRAERSRIFWEIELLCAATTAVCLAAWLVVILCSRQYAAYYAVLTMTLLSAAFDISWFFGGLEQYRLIVLRNMAVKLAGIALLFLLIRRPEDLLLYMALTAGCTLAGNLSMWSQLRRFLEPADWRQLRPARHLRETFVYFIPTIATSVYTILDKTMLGWFMGADKSQNGYYEYATGFVNMAKILILSFNAVMSARMSWLFAGGRQEEIRRRAESSLDFVLLMAIPLAAGLAGIAEGFIPWFLGEAYRPVVPLMYVCSPLVLVVGLSDYMGSQLLTPGGKRAQSGRVIIAGALLNGGLNLLLIPRLGAAGAAGASVTAELFITALYLRLSREYMGPGMLAARSGKRLLAALLMLGEVFAAGRFLRSRIGVGPLATFVQIGSGAAVYFAVLLLLRDRFLLSQLKRLYVRFAGEA